MVRNSLAQVTFTASIQEQISEVERKMQAQSDDQHPNLSAAIGHLLSSGGKRVRPAVALLTGGMLGGDRERLTTLGAAIEMLHTATLVHDDLIDGALLRRGIATLNAQWTPAATVLTGDFVFAQAAKLAAETDSIKVMHLFAKTLATIVNGELTQMFSSRGKASREDYEKRIYAKTASMFELATAAAAILSPVDEETVESMMRFGNAIGMAFQIVDDVLDFTGEQATVGKPVASDLRQGLVTLPALYYFEMHPQDEDMLAVTKGAYYQDDLIDRLVRAIRESGAIERALSEATRYVNQAMEILSGQPTGAERASLEDLASFIVRRHR